MPTESNATETLNLQDATVDLYVGSTVINQNIQADRMDIDHTHGIQERVVIFKYDGKRKVVRIRQVMEIPQMPLGVSLTPAIHDDLDQTPILEDEERKLLAIYDRFTKRTY